MECQVCKSKDFVFFTEKNGFKIVKCKECGLLFVQNVPLDLSSYYSEGYYKGQANLDGYVDYESDKKVNEVNYKNHLKQIQRLLNKKNGVFLEIGCATGYFMELAREEGWSVEGVEISDYAAAVCRKKGLRVIKGIIQDTDVEANLNKFDVVVLFDVIEHVKNPRTDLDHLWHMIRPGGLMVIATPDAGSFWARLWGKRWHAIVPPQHLYFFNENNLGQLLIQTGFKKIHAEHSGKYFRLPYVVRMLYSWTGCRIWSKILALVNRSAFLSKITIPINLGDTLFIIARKS